MDFNKKMKPVNERFAGVILEGEVLPRVSRLIACRLKKIGYDYPTKWYYDGENIVCPDENNISEEMVAAPLLEEVRVWLESKGVRIYVFNKAERVMNSDGVHYKYVAQEEWCRTVFVKDSNGVMVQYKRPINPFSTYDQAMAIAIREGISALM